MKIKVDPKLLTDPATSIFYRALAQQINLLSEGKAAALYQSAQSMPTATGAPGDFVANSAPAELGILGSKYVIEGWHCLVGGAWVEKRFLTGN